MKRAAWVIGSVPVLIVIFYASLFVFAEARTEIVVLRTYDAAGAPHETRVTVIDLEGIPWVRGRPYRGWFERIEANPMAALHRGGAWQPVTATISRAEKDAADFERVMIERHGLLYRYFNFFARMSTSEIPVRLDLRVDNGRSFDPSDSVLGRDS